MLQAVCKRLTVLQTICEMVCFCVNGLQKLICSFFQQAIRNKLFGKRFNTCLYVFAHGEQTFAMSANNLQTRGFYVLQTMRKRLCSLRTVGKHTKRLQTICKRLCVQTVCITCERFSNLHVLVFCNTFAIVHNRFHRDSQQNKFIASELEKLCVVVVGLQKQTCAWSDGLRKTAFVFAGATPIPPKFVFVV